MGHVSFWEKLPTFVKGKRAIIFLVSFLAFNTLLWQNCSKKSPGSGVDVSSSKLEGTEDELFSLISEGEDLIVKLNSFDVTADKESELLQESPKVTKNLRVKIDQILNMIKTEGIATNSNQVLKEVDMLLNLVSKGRDIQVTYDSIRRDKLLDIKFSNLIQDLANQIGQFKALVESRLNGLDAKIASLESKAVELRGLFENFVQKSTAEDRLLREALQTLETSTDKKIAEVKFEGKKLSDKLEEQASKSAEAQEALKKVTDLQNKLCQLDGNGNAIIVNGCLTVDTVNCNTLFSNPNTVPEAVNQCNLLLNVVRNHDSQLRAIKAVDEKQNDLIDGIIQSVTSLNQQVQTVGEALGEMSNVLKAFDAKISQINERLMIVEFKASKTEAAAAIRARANFTLSWIARRTADINNHFCENSTNAALNLFDYETAIQDWSYCREKLSLLNEAQVLTQIALTFANELESVNVDTKCSASISAAGNIQADSIAMTDLTKKEIADEVIKKCVTGGPAYAKTLMLNAVKFLASLGPDHRTYEYMGKLAPIASILFLGDKWENSASKKDSFENTDPTSADLKDTYYGRVERIFVNRYVETVFRIDGKFPEDPNAIKVPSSLGYVFTKRQISEATAVGSSNGPSYMSRLKAQEVACNDCGFEMTARNSAAPGKNKSRFSFPEDPRPDLCPIDDDVIVKHQDGFYGYHISYSHINENFAPVLWAGQHLKLASTAEDVSTGNFAQSYHRVIVPRAGYETAQIPERVVLRATRPYGNAYARPNCVKFSLTPLLKKNEWQKPESMANADGLAFYLNGFSDSYFQNACKAKDYPVEIYTSGKPGRRSPASYGFERDAREKVTALRESWSNPAGSNASVKAQEYVIPANTQLMSNYFVFKYRDMAYTGQNIVFGMSNPFFRPLNNKTSVTGTDFIRETEYNMAVLVQECDYCKRDKDLSNLNPNCDPTVIKDN